MVQGGINNNIVICNLHVCLIDSIVSMHKFASYFLEHTMYRSPNILVDVLLLVLMCSPNVFNKSTLSFVF